MTQSIALPMTESTQVGEARRCANQMAARMELDDTTRGEFGSVVTEVANNLVKHAQGGELLLRELGGAHLGVEVLALDKGPGISNVARSLEDGYSTSGTPGTGLGAIRRLSRLFDIYSIMGQGTALVAHVLKGEPNESRRESDGVELGAVNLPCKGEFESGDSWSVYSGPRVHKVIVADGLGHGPPAAEASREAARIFDQYPDRRPAQMLESIHLALRSTRGAAASIMELDLEAQEVRYTGVGNISACIVTPTERRNMVSHNGTIGHQVRKVQEFVYPWSYASLLIMHSDGIATHWSLDSYPSLASKHPALVAGILYRDFVRGRDDASIVVLRESRISTSKT
jgi:anti-sigma regulatory factor (Ser/Thr protein kinase)